MIICVSTYGSYLTYFLSLFQIIYHVLWGITKMTLYYFSLIAILVYNYVCMPNYNDSLFLYIYWIK